jgi:hypothetical protein
MYLLHFSDGFIENSLLFIDDKQNILNRHVIVLTSFKLTMHYINIIQSVDAHYFYLLS